ncbi:MAG TPA: hypothetical protein VF586_10975, partial [Pyrinomonadaceae bacterium]
MLRKLCFILAGAALLTAPLLKSNTAKASPDMQTITLNTGYDHSQQKAYTVGPADSFWTLIQDPSSSTAEPRPANTINRHPAWSAVQGASQWISFSPTGSGPGLLKGTYVYQKCFCLTKALWENPEAISQSSLNVSVRADDAFYLGLNTMPDPSLNASYLLTNMTGGGGGYTGPAASLSVKGEKLLPLLQPGRNCLNVRVEDMGEVIT